MNDDPFISTAQERVTSDLPRLNGDARDQQRSNLQGALEQARAHLVVISHNPRAVKIQQDIISRYEAALSSLTDTGWIDQ